MVQNIGQLFGFAVASDSIMNVVNAICGVLIVLGILNNPTKTATETQETTEETTTGDTPTDSATDIATNSTLITTTSSSSDETDKKS